MTKCSQCGKPAVINYGDLALCAEHYYKVMQADYWRFTILAIHRNFIYSRLEADEGGLVPFPRIEIPPPLSLGDEFTFNNINVDGSMIGAINTGTVKNLDASITIMRSHGDSDLATAIAELTEAVIKSKEVNDSAKDEINEQLEFLIAQVTSEAQNRSIGLIKSVLAGIRDSISVAAGLLAIWGKVEPLIRAALGI
ncbi:hypothetical protein ACFLX4_00070 [Chloroflexota bacterium]